MNIGLISDTHDDSYKVKAALDLFNKHNVHYIFHAGDITSPATAIKFAQNKSSKLIAVFGNCDLNTASIASSIKPFNAKISKTSNTQLNNKTIYMTHIPKPLSTLEHHDLIIFGHTHKPIIQNSNSSLIINPGSLSAIVLNLSNLEVIEIKYF